MIKQLKALAKYLDSPKRKEQLQKVQYHHPLYQGPPANPGDTRVTRMKNMFQQCLLYYHGLNFFRDEIKSELGECDGLNPKHYDELFVTVFYAILKK